MHFLALSRLWQLFWFEQNPVFWRAYDKIIWEQMHTKMILRSTFFQAKSVNGRFLPRVNRGVQLFRARSKLLSIDTALILISPLQRHLVRRIINRYHHSLTIIGMQHFLLQGRQVLFAGWGSTPSLCFPLCAAGGIQPAWRRFVATGGIQPA